MPPFPYWISPAVLPIYVTIVGAFVAAWLAAGEAWKSDLAARAAASQIALQDRMAVLSQLRAYYIAGHDNVPAELASGVAWPANDWINDELSKMGFTWKVKTTGPRVEFIAP